MLAPATLRVLLPPGRPASQPASLPGLHLSYHHLHLQVPCDKAVLKLLPAAEALAAQAQGQFSAAALLEGQADAGRGKAPAPVLADWVGPLEVFPSLTAGRGLRATWDVRAGELLLVEQSVATAQVCPLPALPTRACCAVPAAQLQSSSAGRAPYLTNSAILCG